MYNTHKYVEDVIKLPEQLSARTPKLAEVVKDYSAYVKGLAERSKKHGDVHILDLKSWASSQRIVESLLDPGSTRDKKGDKFIAATADKYAGSKYFKVDTVNGTISKPKYDERYVDEAAGIITGSTVTLNTQANGTARYNYEEAQKDIKDIAARNTAQAQLVADAKKAASESGRTSTVPTPDKEEKKTGNFLKDNGGLVFGGLAAILSLFSGGSTLMTIIAAVAGVLLGNAFGGQVGDMVSGLFGGKDKKPAAPDKAREPELAPEVRNIQRVKEATGMNVTATQIDAVNTDADKTGLSKAEIQALAVEYKKDPANAAFTLDMAAVDTALTPSGGSLPLAQPATPGVSK